jgi:hypothetical protein
MSSLSQVERAGKTISFKNGTLSRATELYLQEGKKR